VTDRVDQSAAKIRVAPRRRRRDTSDFVVPRSGTRTIRVAIQALQHLAMLAASFVAVAPLYLMVVTSLKTTEEFSANSASIAPPKDVTFEKYAEAWTDLDFSLLMQNSLVLSLVTAAVTTCVSALAAFALAQIDFKGRRILLVLTISLMSVPAIVVVVPLFKLFTSLGLLNAYPSAIVAEIGISIPFGVYLAYTFMREIPRELFLAAAVDGASRLRQLVSVALPLSRPVLTTIALVTGVFAWNDLLIPLVLWQSEELQVLMVGLANLAPGRAGAVDIPLAMAGVSMSVLPIVALFLVAQRAFVRGLVEGGVK
jgi:ABC-type glycerol-3-phosphate transport system permease component